ncbi:MAG: porin [Pseudomonadota bacterium]
MVQIRDRVSALSRTAWIVGSVIGASGAALPAAAQAVGDRFQAEPIASLSVVLAPGIDGRSDDGLGGARASQAALAELELGARAEYVLDNGAEIGGRLVWRAQRDHPNRPGGAGSPIPGDGTVVGAFSGLSNANEAVEAGARGSLELAFIYVSGGYGEITLGRDLGVAARFQEGDVDVFSMARAEGARLDVTGLSIARTRADLTGPAEKLSYTTPRILGVRAGLSYTPVADRSGLDRNPVFRGGGSDGQELQSITEFGLNVSHRFRSSGTRIRAGLGYGAADLEARGAEASVGGSVETWSAGGEVSRGDVSFGVSYLESDEGAPLGDYSAWSLGGAYAWQDWTGSITMARTDADSVSLGGDAYSVGVSRAVGKYGTFTVGYQDVEAVNAAQIGRKAFKRGGIVIELSLSL